MRNMADLTKTSFLTIILFSIQLDSHVVNSDAEINPRKLTTEINPGCNSTLPADCNQWTNLSLIHIRADSSKDMDSLHFIWSFNGSPSLLLARTPLDSLLNIDWSAYLNHVAEPDDEPIMSFNGSSPYYTFGWSLSNIWIFNDESDVVFMNKVNQTQVLSYHSKHFVWERIVEECTSSESMTKLTFKSETYLNHSLGPGGNFKISVTVRNTDGYGGDILPYMLHNEKNSLVEMTLSNVQMDYPAQPNYPKTRVGYGFTLVQQKTEDEASPATMRIDETESLDDEHAPGVFEMHRLLTPVVGPFSDQSYLEWRPICYTNIVSRDISNSIDVHSYSLSNQSTFGGASEAVEGSVLMLYYGRNITENHSQLLIEYMNITFGTEKDGWYARTPNTIWTFMTGFGIPPSDRVSLLVILVLSIGLGIPVVMIIGAGIYIFTKRLSKPRDDLLLGR